MTIQIAASLRVLLDSGKTIYARCNPEVPDFTVLNPKAELLLSTSTKEIAIPLENVKSVTGLLNAAIFQNENINLLTWDIKNYFSYIRYFTKAPQHVSCYLFDLKLLEYFLGNRSNAPQTHQDALERAKIVKSDISFKKAKNVSKSVLEPLATDVIPALETYGLHDKQKKQILHPYYEIEGQVNGRLRTEGKFSRSYVPHNLSKEQRQNLIPGRDEVFMYLDYKYMEVSFLQWLSEDERLGQILELDEDLYKVIFKLVTGGVCDTEKKRDTCKEFFLGIIYGMQEKTLSENLKISLIAARSIIEKVYNLFPKSLGWIKERQEKDVVLAGHLMSSCGTCSDIHGRRREITLRHQIRNFLVSSPAATFCLEKLISLHKGLNSFGKVACHIHDGYVVTANKSFAKAAGTIAKEILESESVLCPGLKLKSSCKTGSTLAQLNEGEQ